MVLLVVVVGCVWAKGAVGRRRLGRMDLLVGLADPMVVGLGSLGLGWVFRGIWAFARIWLGFVFSKVPPL